jgi:hypothetical protein
MGCHPSHETRISDASSFDEICIHCGATDVLGGWGQLQYPCPKAQLKEVPKMTPDQLTISHAQKYQPWTVPYSQEVNHAKAMVPHILATHNVLHAIKTLGKLAAVFEKADHGSPIHIDEVLTIGEMSADLVTAALRFANLYGFDLAKVLVERVEEKNGVNILHIHTS